MFVDELPTIYFRGLDNLIATARSNKVAVCLGFQDFSQLKRDYGDKEAAVVMNTQNTLHGQNQTVAILKNRVKSVLGYMIFVMFTAFNIFSTAILLRRLESGYNVTINN